MSRVSGLEEVIRNLNREVQKIEKRTLKGLIRAAILVLRDVELTPPKTPVDLGNLRASRFLVTSTGEEQNFGGSFTGPDASKLSPMHSAEINRLAIVAQSANRPMVIMGFSAYYAVYVHEMVGATFNRPGSGAKFFQAAIRRNTSAMLRIIKEEAAH